jgi:site-specific recombinase XerD
MDDGVTTLPASLVVPLQEHSRRGRRERSGIKRKLAVLKKLFTKAIEWRKVAKNPVKRVRLYREQNARTHYLTEDEKARLVAACSPP